MQVAGALRVRGDVLDGYTDVFTSEALDALTALAPFDADRRRLMRARIERRERRRRNREPLAFLPADGTIGGTGIRVSDARAGTFDGSEIPPDLQRQWIQGTGPAARPRSDTRSSIRNVAYALLSGADGWMFDGEDALGQVDTMSLDNQRNLKLGFSRSTLFMDVAESVAGEMNAWAEGFLGRRIVEDWRSQLDFTTRIFRPRGLHLDDRHVAHADGVALSASIVDVVLYVANNHATLRDEGRSIVLYLPKIQTAEEAALWNDILTSLERHLQLPAGTIKTYVLVEQIEAAYQLMEIRAALGLHFVGFNTGRWDYINSVSDAAAWDPAMVNPNIDAITMTFGYMRVYEDRVRRAVNTPDRQGRFALWQGGMEPNIPVGSAAGVQAGMTRAVGGATREESEGASGKWVAHWKMVHIVRPVWEKAGRANAIRNSLWLFPVIESVHLLALALIGGAVLLVDLRLLGLGLRRQPVAHLARDVQPWLAGGLVVMVTSGILLFLSEAIKCYYSAAFWTKMTFLLPALVFTWTVRRKVAGADERRIRPIWRKLVAAASLTMWSIVGAAGRWIGFSG